MTMRVFSFLMAISVLVTMFIISVGVVLTGNATIVQKVLWVPVAGAATIRAGIGLAMLTAARSGG